METSKPGIEVECGASEKFERVRPLWLELRRHHAGLAPLWSASLLATSFEERRDGLLRKGVNGLAIFLAVVDGRDAGYCVCTIDAERQGTVDSLFVVEECRRRGVGRALMHHAMRWMGERNTSGIVVDVLVGNDAAKRLYEGCGFRERTIRLRYLAEGEV